MTDDFGMLPEPKKPDLTKMVDVSLDIDGHTLQEVIDWAEEQGVDPKDIDIDVEYSSAWANLQRPMSFEEKQEAQIKYEAKMRQYRQWYSDNKERILKMELEKEAVLEYVRRQREDELRKEIEQKEEELKSLRV